MDMDRKQLLEAMRVERTVLNKREETESTLIVQEIYLDHHVSYQTMDVERLAKENHLNAERKKYTSVQYWVNWNRIDQEYRVGRSKIAVAYWTRWNAVQAERWSRREAMLQAMDTEHRLIIEEMDAGREAKIDEIVEMRRQRDIAFVSVATLTDDVLRIIVGMLY
jgi:hypothetical protein